MWYGLMRDDWSITFLKYNFFFFVQHKETKLDKLLVIKHIFYSKNILYISIWNFQFKKLKEKKETQFKICQLDVNINFYDNIYKYLIISSIDIRSIFWFSGTKLSLFLGAIFTIKKK